jgi:hypothetical protein
MTSPTCKRLTGYGKLGPTVLLDNTRGRSRLMPAILCKAVELGAESIMD